MEQRLEDRELGLERGQMGGTKVGAMGGIGLSCLSSVGKGTQPNTTTRHADDQIEVLLLPVAETRGVLPT